MPYYIFLIHMFFYFIYFVFREMQKSQTAFLKTGQRGFSRMHRRYNEFFQSCDRRLPRYLQLHVLGSLGSACALAGPGWPHVSSWSSRFQYRWELQLCPNVGFRCCKCFPCRLIKVSQFSVVLIGLNFEVFCQ